MPLTNLFLPINKQKIVQNMKNFQNCLDYFHKSDLQKLIRTTIAGRQQANKGKMDVDRASYSLLLQHAVQQLKLYQREGPNGVRDPLFIDLELISPLCDELVTLTSRQCQEKGQIIKLVITFYKQSLLLSHLASQEAVKQSLIDYSHNMENHRKAAENQMGILKKQLFLIKKESEEKWRTFYMIVKDNRVLRRQKGKLLRVLQEERMKLCSLHRQLLQIAKQNQKNRLLLNYSQDEKAFAEYLTHSQAVNKLDNFIKQYPRRAKKILRSQLDRLEACENMALDDKIMYILKTAKQAEEILDEYEDLADTNERSNKLIFNISTQTDPFDIGIDSHPPPKKQTRKSQNVSLPTQTQKRRLKIYSKQWEHFSSHFLAKQTISRRRKALKTNAIEDLSIIDAVRHFKDNVIDRKVCNIKIKCRGSNKLQQLQSNLYNVSLNFEPDIKEYPYLHTSYRLQMDIKRSKDISRRQHERRSSRHSLLHSESQAASQHKLDPNMLINQILPSVQLDKQKVQPLITQMLNSESGHSQENKILKLEGKKKSQKYKINKSKGKSKDLGIKVSPSQMSVDQSKKYGNLSAELLGQRSNSQRKSNRASINLQRESIKDLFGLNPRKLSQMAIQKEQQNSLSTLNDNSAGTNLKISIQPTTKIRKSGFAMYKKLQSLPNQVPEESSPESKNSEKKKRITNVDAMNSKEKLKSNNPALVGRKSTLKPQPTVRAIPTAKAIPKSRPEKQSSIFADLSNLQVAVNPPTHIKTNASMKIINIFSPQCSRLLDKITKLIFLRRKQISQSAPVFEQFLMSFLAFHYGNRKFIINTKICKNRGGQHPLFPIYDYLLNHTVSSDFLQHSFRLFARLLMFTGSDHPFIDSSRSQDVQAQLLLLHYSQQKCRESNISASLSSIYLNTIKQIKYSLDSSQIYQFLVQLLPRSQNKIHFQELREILYLFSTDNQYVQRLISIKKLCNPDVTILNLCFHAIKEEWRPLLFIKDYISNELHAYSHLHSQEEQPQIISSLLKTHFPWLSAIIQSKIKQNENSGVIQKTATLLHKKIVLESGIPISNYLLEFQQQFISLSIKKQTCF